MLEEQKYYVIPYIFNKFNFYTTTLVVLSLFENVSKK